MNRPTHRPFSPAAAVAACALAAGVALAGCTRATHAPGSPDAARHARSGDDRSALQGTWEQLPEEGRAATPQQRVVKQVSGDGETVTTYDERGGVVHAQSAKFRLGRSGDVPTFTFYDRKITAGPQQGRNVSAPSTFVYRLRGDEFDEVWGLLPGQEERALVIKRWKRVSQ